MVDWSRHDLQKNLPQHLTAMGVRASIRSSRQMTQLRSRSPIMAWAAGVRCLNSGASYLASSGARWVDSSSKMAAKLSRRVLTPHGLSSSKSGAGCLESVHWGVVVMIGLVAWSWSGVRPPTVHVSNGVAVWHGTRTSRVRVILEPIGTNSRRAPSSLRVVSLGHGPATQFASHSRLAPNHTTMEGACVISRFL